jgi:hypothetical protein
MPTHAATVIVNSTPDIAKTSVCVVSISFTRVVFLEKGYHQTADNQDQAAYHADRNGLRMRTWSDDADEPRSQQATANADDSLP